MKRFLLIIIIVFLMHAFPLAAHATRLVKVKGANAVYFVDDGGVRHTYPQQKVFESWYRKIQDTKSNIQHAVEIVSVEELVGMKLGENVMMRHGSLVKIQSAPQVYAVEQGGVLRPLVGEQTAIDLYGAHWAARVTDVSEVFFFNYKIGAPVKGRADLPDGTVVKLEGSGSNLYYKDKGVLTLLKDAQAVQANNLDVKYAVTIPQLFPVRSRAIIGREQRITDPQWGTLVNGADCAAATLRAAILYLSRGNSSAVEKINIWRTSTASAWERRTDVLSLIAIDPAEEIAFDDRYLLEGKLDIQEIARTYFDAHSDAIDFLFIWNALLPAGTSEIAEFWPVTNVVEGLGKPLFERGELYGSKGKLKGVINMGRPGDYPLDDTAGMARAAEIGLHEMLHQWSGEADFRDTTGADRVELQTSDGYHWSPFVDIISPLGGWGWKDNNDGSFTSVRSLISVSQLFNLHFPDLDLYLMGLVPRHSVAPVRYLKPEKPSDALAATMRGALQTVSIDDIVYGNGVRRCSFGH